MRETSEAKSGVWTSLKCILDTLLATAQNRVALLAVELQEEKRRVVEAMLCAAAVAAFGMMTLTLVTFTVVVLFWENGRLPALAILSAVFFVGTVLAWRTLQSQIKGRKTFAATLDELKKDRACLETEN